MTTRGAVAGTTALFVATQALALTLSGPVGASGLVLDPGDGGAATGLAAVVAGLALGSLLVLAIVRFGLPPMVVRAVLVGSFGVAIALVARAALPVGWALAVALALGAVAAVWVHPEWYVVDAVTVAAVAGVAALLGMSLGRAAVLALLVGMAVYDAFAVYRSGHMLTLADAAAGLGAPTMFVVPTERGVSARNITGVDPDAAGDGGAFAVLGAGDALFPAVLAVAGLGVGAAVAGPVTLPALGAVAGSLVGMAALQALVHARPGVHAGLPFLDGGAIAGYLVAGAASGVPLARALGLG